MGIQFDRALLDETLYFTGDSAKVKISDKSPNPIPFSGENKKNILILYRTIDGNKLPDNDEQTLMRLITAVQCTLKDVALVNFDALPVKKYHLLKPFFQPRIVLLFGLSCPEISLYIETEFYKPIVFNSTTFLSSLRFDQLNKIQKSYLWKELQQIFNV